MIVRYRTRALSDIQSIHDYLHELSERGAFNVLRAIYAGIQLLADQPFVGQMTNDPSVRVKIVRRYRYKIFYSVIEDEQVVEVLHIRHTSRRPWIVEDD